MWTIIIAGFLSLLFFVIGSFMNLKNARLLLSGYNTLSRKEQDQIDLTPYLRFNRRFHFFLGASLLAIVLLLYFFGRNEDAAGMVIAIYPILAYTWYVWKCRKLQSAYTKRGALNAGLTVMILVLGGVVTLMYFGFREDRLTVKNAMLHIDGMYNVHLKAADISTIVMSDTLPPISFRSNGFSLATKRKGYYVTENGEQVKLILNSKNPPYLLILQTDGRRIFYNASAGNTRSFADSVSTLLASQR